MTDQTAAPEGAATDKNPPPLSADDLSLAAPLAESVKDESEIWDELQASKAKADADKATGEVRTPEGGSGKEPGSDEQAKPADADKPDIWANATPEQKTAWDAAQQRIRSGSGRISALQRKINQLSAAHPSRDTTERARTAVAGIKDDYPEVHPALDAFNARLDARDAADAAELKAAEVERAALIDAQEEALHSAHSDWKQITGVSGDQAAKNRFLAWVYDQPLRVREAAMDNDGEITNASAAIFVIDAYKKFLGQQTAPAARQTPPQQQQVPQSAQPQPQLDDRRQRQLSASQTPQGGNGRATVAGIPADGDPEEIWRAIQAEKARKRA